MLIRVGNQWTLPTIAKAYSSGTFERSTNPYYIRVGGVWKQAVPPSAIILYAVDGGLGLLANGNNGTPNLLGRYVVTDTIYSTLGLSGLDSHVGTLHGDATLSCHVESSGRLVDGWNLFDATTYLWNSNYFQHFHSVGTNATHSHSGLAFNRPLARNLVPRMGADHIGPEAIILSDRTLASALLQAVIYNRYLRMDGYAGNYGSNVHNHGSVSVTLNTSAAANALASESSQVQTRTKINHSHVSVSHTSVEQSNEPSSRDVFTYRTLQSIWMDDLPIGSILLATSMANFPSGWTYVPAITPHTTYGRYYLKSTGTWGQTDRDIKHYHTDGFWSGASSGTRTCRKDLSSSSECISNAHTHSVSGTHATKVDHSPLAVNLLMMQKFA